MLFLCASLVLVNEPRQPWVRGKCKGSTDFIPSIDDSASTQLLHSSVCFYVCVFSFFPSRF